MSRYFNTAGPCRPGEHYMLPPQRRLPEVWPLLERGQYFAVHAPRQSGKTTCFRALAEELTDSGRFAALLTTCETGQRLEPDLDRSIAAVLDTLRQQADERLAPELRPPAVDPSVPAETRVRDLLARWSSRCPPDNPTAGSRNRPTERLEPYAGKRARTVLREAEGP